MGERCAVERRLEGRRAYYLAVARADAAALDQLGRVLAALGWHPVGDGGRLYERG